MDDTRRIKELMAAWLEFTGDQPVYCGLEREEALRRARELLDRLREGKASPEGIDLEKDEDFKDVLYALTALVSEPGNGTSGWRAGDAAAVARFIRQISWPHDIFGEKDLLLNDCAALIRRTEEPEGRVIRPGQQGEPSEERHRGYGAREGIKPRPGEASEAGRSKRSSEAYSLFCSHLGTIHFVLGRLYGLTRDEAAGIAHTTYEWFDRFASRETSSKMPIASLRLPLLVAICRSGQNLALEKLGAEPDQDIRMKEILRRDPEEVAQEIERTLRDQNGHLPGEES